MATIQPKALILDVYGGCVRRIGGWIAVADLIVLMDDLGVDEQAVRSAISRMKRRQLLVREERGGNVGYALSDHARAILAEGDRRIFTAREPADLSEGWALAVFSLPQHERGRRHVLRSRLRWLGFASVGAGVWIAPHRMLGEARDALARLGLEPYVELFEAHHRGFRDVDALVERAWDLGALRALYAEFVAAHRPVLAWWAEDGASDGDGDLDRRAFVDFTHALSQWRRFPYLDPGLPAELLPADWEGRAAAALFFALAERVEKRAYRHVERVTAG